MSRTVQRRYRVRIGQRGAVEIDESSVDFVLDVPDLGEAPVVAGSFVHPLDGATELRPLHVLGIDTNGALIDAFSTEGRWAALGRLVDIQWQDAADDPISDEWTTYGTGRCSGLDEQDGPGRFRIEISDESWTARKNRVFTEGGTTALYPQDRLWGRWKGYPHHEFNWPLGRTAEIDDTLGDLVRIRLRSLTTEELATLRSDLVEYIRSLILPAGDLDFGSTAGTHGNFRGLVLRYHNT